LVLVQKTDWLQALGHEQLVTVAIAGLMIVVAGIAYKFANQDALRENEFSFGPVKESRSFSSHFCHDGAGAGSVEKHAGDLGIATVRQFYWGSGVLSSVLDNAPTYLNFLTAAFGLQHLSLETPAHVAKVLADPCVAIHHRGLVRLGFFRREHVHRQRPESWSRASPNPAREMSELLRLRGEILAADPDPIFAVVSWLFLRSFCRHAAMASRASWARSPAALEEKPDFDARIRETAAGFQDFFSDGPASARSR